MRLKDYLQEGYVSRVKGQGTWLKGNNTVEVFNFPDRKELRGLTDVRFVIDIGKEKFYVWDANSQIVHDDVWKQFGVKTKDSYNGLCRYDKEKHKFVDLGRYGHNRSGDDNYKLYSFSGHDLIDALEKKPTSTTPISNLRKPP